MPLRAFRNCLRRRKLLGLCLVARSQARVALRLGPLLRSAACTSAQVRSCAEIFRKLRGQRYAVNR